MNVPDKNLLAELLACPQCHGGLRPQQSPPGYVCEACKLLYAIDDGLPNMLVDDARPWSHAGTDRPS